MNNKNKILVLIPNYGIHQINYLHKILREYSKFKKITPKIILFSTNITENLDDYSIDIDEIIVNSEIGLNLSKLPRITAIDNINTFDYYMHQENDTLITEDNILTFIEGQNRLDAEFGISNTIHGFIRYENVNNNIYLIDMHKSNTHSIGKIIDDKLIVDNVHQGGWIINNNQLNIIINKNINFGDSLEDSCSNIYFSNKWPGSNQGLKKYIYSDLIEKSIIYHMPNKYSNLDSNYLTLKELLS